jgi:hypothetical protein
MSTSNLPDVPEIPGIDLDFTPPDYFASRALLQAAIAAAAASP